MGMHAVAPGPAEDGQGLGRRQRQGGRHATPGASSDVWLRLAAARAVGSGPGLIACLCVAGLLVLSADLLGRQGLFLKLPPLSGSQIPSLGASNVSVGCISTQCKDSESETAPLKPGQQGLRAGSAKAPSGRGSGNRDWAGRAESGDSAVRPDGVLSTFVESAGLQASAGASTTDPQARPGSPWNPHAHGEAHKAGSSLPDSAIAPSIGDPSGPSGGKDGAQEEGKDGSSQERREGAQGGGKDGTQGEGKDGGQAGGEDGAPGEGSGLCREDRELFSRALATAPKGPPKIAFLFLVRGPLPLGGLWRSFFKGHTGKFSIYIHTAEDYIYEFSDIPPMFRGRQIPSKESEWGTMSLVDAERRLLANALLDPGNARFVLACETCFPLFDFHSTYRLIMGSPTSFLESDIGGGLNWTPEFLPLIPQADWSKGSAWFTLLRAHAAAAVADTEYYKVVKDKLSTGHQEHFFQTLLYKKQERGTLSSRSLMSEAWPRNASGEDLPFHPIELTTSNMQDDIVHDTMSPQCTWSSNTSAPCFLFARKIANETLNPLLALLPINLPPEATSGVVLPDGATEEGGGVEEEDPGLCPEDRELFSRALATAAKGDPKIAFLFMVRGPMPLAPVWAKFFEGHTGKFSIYMHAAENFTYDDSDIPRVFRGRQVPSKEARWGTMTIVDAERRLLANALLDPGNARFMLVCETCVPLFDFPSTYRLIIDTPTSFLESDIGGGLYWTPEFLPLIPQADWSKGSAWFTLLRAHAVTVVADTEYYKVVKGKLWNGYDEHFYQTLLYKKEDRATLVRRTLMFVGWPRTAKGRIASFHPLKYNTSQVTPDLVHKMAGPQCMWPANIRAPCFLFGRKFLSDTLKPLMELLPAQMVTKQTLGADALMSKRAQREGKVEATEENDGAQREGKDRPPRDDSGLFHQDRELFSRALATAPEGPPKIAFMFLAREPLPLADLWAKFFEGHTGKFSIYIHTGRGVALNDSDFPPVFRGRQVSKRARRGYMRIVDAGRRLLANALLDPGNARFVILSEACVPLFDFPSTYRLIMDSPTSFVDSDIGGGWNWTPEFLPLIPQEEWSKGSAWFTLLRAHAVTVVADTEYYKAVKGKIKGGYEEHYYQTLLYKKEDPATLTQRSLMFESWPRNAAGDILSFEATSLNSSHVTPGLVYNMTSPRCMWPGNTSAPCFLFARKFSNDTVKPLLGLLPAQMEPAQSTGAGPQSSEESPRQGSEESTRQGIIPPRGLAPQLLG